MPSQRKPFHFIKRFLLVFKWSPLYLKKLKLLDENFLTWGLFHIISLWHYEYCWNERDTTSYYGNIKLETRFIGGASLAGILGGSYRGRAPATFMTASPWFFGLFPPGQPWRKEDDGPSLLLKFLILLGYGVIICIFSCRVKPMEAVGTIFFHPCFNRFIFFVFCPF